MKKTVIAFLVLIVAMLVTYKYLYHDHRDISNEKPLFSITVNELLKDFLADENKANTKYLDKSITIKGKITNIDLPNKTIVLDEKVFVILLTSTEVKLNTEVSIQGRLIGYDSLLEEIKIDQAQIK
jgi:hypothetical protein